MRKPPQSAGVFPVDVAVVGAEVIVFVVAFNVAVAGGRVPSVLDGPVAERTELIPLLADNDSPAPVVFEGRVGAGVTLLPDTAPGGVQAILFTHGASSPGI